MKKIIIVGAGPGGLAAGLILSSKGYDVSIYEKDDVIGGRSKKISQDGFSFSLGPSFVVYLDAYKWLFKEAGLDFDKEVSYHRLDPLYQINKKNETWDLPGTFEVLKKDIDEKFGELKTYEAFMKKEEKTVNAMHPVMLIPFHSRLSLINKNVVNFGKFIGIDKMKQKIEKRFKSEILKDSMQFQTKYLGMTPQETPGFFTMLSYLEHALGIYHIDGGVPKLMEIMASHIKKNKGTIHLNAPVQKIISKGNKATGVLVNDEVIDADHIIVNADMPKMVETLLENNVKKKYTDEKIAKKTYSVSAYMLYLGLKKKKDYPVHTLILADDYETYTQTLKENKNLPKDMSLYVYHPSAIDKSFAPENQSSLMVLAPVPNNDANINWDTSEVAFRKDVIKRLKERMDFDENDIVFEKTYTPIDWENDGIYKGAIFAMKHTLNQLLHKRPHNRYEDLKNLYLVGGSTHPGSGLPIIFESAMISSRLIEKS
jgi:phytoene desaturase